MIKILSSVVGVLLVAIGILAWQLQVKIKDLEYEQLKNATLELKLKEQNEAVAKLKLDTQKFKDSLESKNQAIEKKYSEMLAKNKDLESKLRHTRITLKPAATPPTNITLQTCQAELLSYKEAINLSVEMLAKRFQQK